MGNEVIPADRRGLNYSKYVSVTRLGDLLAYLPFKKHTEGLGEGKNVNLSPEIPVGWK